MKNKIRISICDENGEYRNLFKLITYKSGGFAFILPRLIDTNLGRLEKTIVTYKNMGTHLDIRRDKAEQYGANDIVKFSYHPDGFVQFSSTTNNRIISGRNSDGTPKGLGVISWPLSDPIGTGPSMTISFWGLDKFIKEPVSKVDKRYVFDIREATIHPKAKFRKNDKIAFAMAMYIIPNSLGGNIIVDKDGKKTAHIAMMQGLPDGTAFMRLRELVRIIDIPSQDYRIGISWFIIPDKFKSEGGYRFLGPTDGKRGLVATYPADYQRKLKMKDLSWNS